MPLSTTQYAMSGEVLTAPAASQEASSLAARPSSASNTASPPTSSAPQNATPSSPTSPSASGSPTWPDLSPDHPLSKLNTKLPTLIAQATYTEVYGIDIDPSSEKSTPFLRNLILQKFLRGNANDVEKAAAQLLDTLKWRKQFQPLEVKDAVFSKEKFGGLGYMIQVDGIPGSTNRSDVVTFNVYGAVKDNKSTFGDTEAFLRWRVALMELSIARLRLGEATQPIPDYGEGVDPHQGLQIHDYLGVSFLRQDSHVKAASKEALATFSKYYPETLSRKFFVNVPTLMGWMFSAMKMVLSAETTRKFTVVTYAKDLARELGEGVPEEYGGKAGMLASRAETVNVA